MTLRKRNVDLPLTAGINTKASPKTLTAPEMLKLKNVRLKKGSKNGLKLEKSLGYMNLGQKVNTGTLNTPVALGNVRDELLMLSTDKLYSRSSVDDTWNDKGPITATSTKVKEIAASTIAALAPEVIVQDNVKVGIWLEGTVLYYSVVDQETGSNIVERATLVTSAGSIYPRLAVTTGNIYIFYNESTNLKYVRIPTNAPSTSTAGTLYTTIDSGGMFDVKGLDTTLYIMFKLASGSTIRISRVSSDLNIDASTTIASEDPSSYRSTAIQVFNSTADGEIRIYAGWVDGSDNLNAVAYDNGLVQLFSPALVENNANISSLIISIDDTTQSSVRYIYGISNADVSTYSTRGNTVDSAGTIGTAADILRSVAPVSRAAYYNNVSYFAVLHESALQSTYFVITNTGRVVAKFAAGVAGTHADSKRPSEFSALTTNSFTFGILKKGRIQSENAVLFADSSPNFAELSLDPSKAFVSTIAHDDFLISGGAVLSYDGSSTTEYGFHINPEDVVLTERNDGNSVANGTYLIYSVYEWIDRRGVRFRSSPSVAQSITTTGGNDTIRVVTPTLRVTDKTSSLSYSSRAEAVIKVYATETLGTIPYYVGEVTNDLTADTVTYDITADLTAHVSNEILYTSGGSLENAASPSCKYIFTHDNRLVALGLEDPNQIRISKSIRPGNGSGFNDDLLIDIDPLGGDIIAGASMDDYMIIFKETAVYAISGSGPNDLGQGSNYSAPQLISSDIGCKDSKSVLQMPDGIIFKSNKGIYLLGRGLELSYFGDKVEDYNDSTILSSDILKTSNEIRFVTDSNVTLVYNYYFKQWTVFDTPGALDATTWKDTEYVYLSANKVLKEDSSTYLNDGSYVQSTIRTGWIHLAGLQGFQRIYKMAMLGTYYANHIFQIKHYYDYSNTAIDINTITAASIVNTAVYGLSATYGADDYYGGSQNNEVYQLREDMPRQKCESVSFEFVDSIVSGGSGQGFSIDGLSLQVGIKTGLHRTSSTRSV